MTIFNYDNGINNQRGYVDVVERDGQLLAKWHFEDDSGYTPVDVRLLPCHHFAGAPLEKTFTFGGWRFWLCDLVSDCIPKRFEYIDVLVDFKDHPKVAKFVTILDEFEHHYSGAKMYHVRIEYMSYFGEYPMVEYKTIGESQLADMLVKHKEG